MSKYVPKYQGKVHFVPFHGPSESASCPHEHRTPEAAAHCVQSTVMRQHTPNTTDPVNRTRYVVARVYVAVKDPHGIWVDWAAQEGITY